RPKRAIKRTRDFRSYHDATARDPTHDRAVRHCPSRNERSAEPCACILPVAEDAVRGHGYAPRERARSIKHASAKGGCMGITAYVLIQTEVGKAANVTASVRKIKGVASADDVTGPYDVIVRTEADTLDD